MFKRNSIPAKLLDVGLRHIRVVFDQQDPPLPCHIATLGNQACGRRFGLLETGSHSPLRGAIGVVGTKTPQPESADIERNPRDGANHRQVQIGTQHEGADDGGKESNPLERGARVPVPQPRDDGQAGRPSGIDGPLVRPVVVLIDHIAFHGLHLQLGAAARTENRGRSHRLVATWTRLHRSRVLALTPVAGHKRQSLREAIADHVKDGDSVSLGLALESGIPFAAVHEMIRQGRTDLTLIGPISDMAFDQMIAAGSVARVIAAWVGNVAAGSGYGFRRAVEDRVPRDIEVEDHSNFTLGLALTAAAMGVPYQPTRTGIGGDIVKDHSRIRPLDDPFGGPPLLAVGALKPDVAIIHVQRADEDGNAHLWGNLGLTVEAAYAARRTILICEEIVAKDVIRSDPNRTQIPGFLVTAVVEEPGGALPSSVQGYWRRDFAPFLDYHRESRTQEGFESWLRRWVLEVPDRATYLQRLGEPALERLRVRDQRLAAPANFAP
jgi:glutaconate CoA-transferase subunit A